MILGDPLTVGLVVGGALTLWSVTGCGVTPSYACRSRILPEVHSAVEGRGS